jgi:hypothetical protein
MLIYVITWCTQALAADPVKPTAGASVAAPTAPAVVTPPAPATPPPAAVTPPPPTPAATTPTTPAPAAAAAILPSPAPAATGTTGAAKMVEKTDTCLVVFSSDSAFRRAFQSNPNLTRAQCQEKMDKALKLSHEEIRARILDASNKSKESKKITFQDNECVEFSFVFGDTVLGQILHKGKCRQTITCACADNVAEKKWSTPKEISGVDTYLGMAQQCMDSCGKDKCSKMQYVLPKFMVLPEPREFCPAKA